MSGYKEIDGKHFVWCIFCNKFVEVNEYHNCAKNVIDDKKPYKGSL